MPPPPPVSVGGANFHVPPSAKVDSCERCASSSLYWQLRDALDELQGLDPLRYFAEPVDEDQIPEYRTVIPDPMDFATMRVKLERGEYTAPKHLADDFRLLCRNAIVFNTNNGNPFRVAAKQLHAAGDAVLHQLFRGDEADVLRDEDEDEEEEEDEDEDEDGHEDEDKDEGEDEG